MVAFEVNDMTCGHCASIITKSLKAIDPNAKVTIDIGRHLVMVEPAAADGDALREAIVDAGYSASAVGVTEVDAKPGRGSCCCHCG
ncbi:MAG: heavy-metal-associated domain-containing protein [Aquabacterium sp.]|nr:heavy-metal-associated domain-containing protein [Aquabacterium sp.]